MDALIERLRERAADPERRVDASEAFARMTPEKQAAMGLSELGRESLIGLDEDAR